MKYRITLLVFIMLSMSLFGAYENVTQKINRIPQFGGEIWYVSATLGDNGNSGKTPKMPLETIGAAIDSLTAGDAITIMAGTYTEIGLDLDTDYCEMWFEIGALLDPATGTALTVSGNSCKIKGQLKITPATDQIGLLVSGVTGFFDYVSVSGGGYGYRITGAGNEFQYCRSANADSIAFDIQAGQQKLISCNTTGNNTDTFGYHINSGSDKGLIDGCTSQAHGAGGYYITDGSDDWTILDCSSGQGDGNFRDIGLNNVWSNFSYAQVLTSLATLDANNETKSYNVAIITGAVTIKNVHIRVTTALSDNITNFYLDVYDGTNSKPISDTPLTISSAPVGSLLTRIADSDEPLDYVSSATVAIVESVGYKKPQSEVIVNAKEGTTTYLRMTYTTTNTPSSGQIRGYIEFEKVTDDGWIELVE